MSMSERKNSPTEKAKKIRYPKHWYVMFHLEPDDIEAKLQQENEKRKDKGLRLFEYFIPYQFLPNAEPDAYAKDAASQKEQAEASNDLRKALRTYVFIKGTLKEMVRLVSQEWNRQSRLQLFFRRSHDGHHIVMAEKKMRQFITTCCENRQRFTFGPPIEDIESYDTVVIKNGVFKDTEAKVIDVQHTATGISVTLGIPFFCGEKTLQLKDYKTSDLNLPHTVETLLNDNFIAQVEKSILTVLAHRIKGTGDGADGVSDEAILNQVYHYSYVQMNDSSSHLRFRCMLIICAALRMDDDGRKALADELCSLLSSGKVLSEADAALIRASLYIATAHVEYRAAAKEYWQTHREEETLLCRLMPLVTRISRKFFKHHRITHFISD